MPFMGSRVPRRHPVVIDERLQEESNVGEDERTVGTAETEGILDCDINLHIARGVGAVIEIAGGILVEDVDSGR